MGENRDLINRPFMYRNLIYGRTGTRDLKKITDCFKILLRQLINQMNKMKIDSNPDYGKK